MVFKPNAAAPGDMNGDVDPPPKLHKTGEKQRQSA